MGLDQYLSASEYISRVDYTADTLVENPLFKQMCEQFDVSLDPTGFAGIAIEFPMGYWRKANQIHNWFVLNVQDGDDNCGSYYVSRENLEELKDLCVQVLADPELAEDLLPTSSGFFFGSTEYDSGYASDLKNTIEIIDRCLSSRFSGFEYSSSW